jgi:hypothetical protein
VVRPRAGAIAGVVRRAGTNAAIPAATVICGTGHAARTAADGSYTTSDLAPGTHRCTASANRYAPSTRTMTVASGETTTADFTLVRR